MVNRLAQGIAHVLHLPMFSRGEAGTTAWQVIGWWEARRTLYNAVLVASCAITGVLCLVTGLVSEKLVGIPYGIPESPFMAVMLGVIGLIVANICYTGGWIVELLIRKFNRGESRNFPEITFSFGLLFSALVILLPGVLVVVLAGIQIAKSFLV